ncbi:tilS/hprT [Symbiodinium necroappetens]|uniref:tRNA(Ile)-lysidine synthetase n=1 Tax=Symbiodinium necroappetens TaxID=1628268 RepID=A0A812R3K8_9DINO|nr:tilS/hprT [Symbiodinium necroappetens]
MSAFQVLMAMSNKDLALSSEAKESLRRLVCTFLSLPHGADFTVRLHLLANAILLALQPPDLRLQRLLEQLPSPDAALLQGAAKDCGPLLIDLLKEQLFHDSAEPPNPEKKRRAIEERTGVKSLRVQFRLREKTGAPHTWPWPNGMEHAEPDWVTGLSVFCEAWFPSEAEQGQSIPGYWFGARKASYRPLFDKLNASCLEPARRLAAAGQFRRMWWPRWEPSASARMRLKAAIFLDQTSRNYQSTQRGDDALLKAARVKEQCDAVALQMALSVVAAGGGTANGAFFLQLGSVPELCFLSLVLRHTREPCFIQLAEGMLVSIVEELQRSDHGLPSEGLQGHLGLCSRFLEETRDALEAVGVEAYLQRALQTDQPLLIGQPEQTPRLEVLDQRCQAHAAGLRFLDPLLCDTARFEQHHLVEELSRSLQVLGFLHAESGIVLSLSGGVDSMVTCCLLWLLRRRLPPEQCFKFCALHLCHPNRDDARDEEGWVRWSCSKLGVELLTYRLKIRRPHGTLRTGISRERYEEKSKQIRFRMYSRCFEHLGVPFERGATLVAHHEDDADENRLAELGKGNIIHIDGMLPSSTTQGVTVIRPFLKVRKAELIGFADLAALCYMQDSTPKWSRRGWIRYVLDEMNSEEQQSFTRLQMLLSRAGEASATLGEAIDESLGVWKESDITSGVISVPEVTLTTGDSKKGQEQIVHGYSSHQVPVVILRLPVLFTLAQEFHQKVKQLMDDFRDIASIWNKAIEKQTAMPNGHGDGARKTGAAHESLDMEDEEAGACPLQAVRVCDGPFEMGPFVLGRAVCVALNAVPEVHRLLGGQLVARKALKHVWDCVVRARREHHWGTLHKMCPFLYVREASSLVLCDAQECGPEFADARWQRHFVAAVTEFLQTQEKAGVTEMHKQPQQQTRQHGTPHICITCDSRVMNPCTRQDS